MGPSHCFARIINFSLSTFPVLRELQNNTQKEVKFYKSKYESSTLMLSNSCWLTCQCQRELGNCNVQKQIPSCLGLVHKLQPYKIQYWVILSVTCPIGLAHLFSDSTVKIHIKLHFFKLVTLLCFANVGQYNNFVSMQQLSLITKDS